MTEQKNKFVEPLKTAKKVEPVKVENVSIEVDKLGYRMNGEVYERIRVQLVKLDKNGSPQTYNGKVQPAKQINIPASITKEELKKIFDNIMAVKDEPLKKEEGEE